MGFLFGKTAMGTYVVVAFWVACYYFFSGMFPTWHFGPGMENTECVIAHWSSEPAPKIQRGSSIPPKLWVQRLRCAVDERCSNQ